MHAVQLRCSLDDAHDTHADAREDVARLHLRLRKKIREDRCEVAPRERTPSASGDGAIAPVREGRLDQIRMTETIARRSVSPAPSQPRLRSAVPIVPIDFVRSQDCSQQIAIDGDTIVIRGFATGAALAPAPRRPSSLAAPSNFAPRRDARPVTVSIAVDGTVYAIRVSAGDSARDTAEALAGRIRQRHSVELVECSDAQTRLRIGF